MKAESKLADFQTLLQSWGSYILSEGTLNLEHLLPRAYDFMNKFGLFEGEQGRTDLRDSIKEFYQPDPEYHASVDAVLETNNFWNCYYRGLLIYKGNFQGDNALTPSDVWESCEYYFNEIAPEGFYFGSLEGDSSCIGWFRVVEDAE